MGNHIFLAHNFGAVPKEYTDEKKSKVIIFPVPYEATTTYKTGTKEGPNAIINASKNMELYDEELSCSPFEVGIHTLQELESDISHPSKTIEHVTNVAMPYVKNDKFVILLGGEHSLSYGMVKAYKEKYPKLSVLQIDAHADLRESYQGSEWSHACAMRKVSELCPVVHVGIRSISEEEAEYIKDKKLKIFYAKDLSGTDWIKDVVKSLSNDVYITIDLDGLDPSIMPAVGTPEPGGLNWYQILELLKTLCGKKNVVGADFVELSPIPGFVAPDFLVGKLVYKLIGYRFEKDCKKI